MVPKREEPLYTENCLVIYKSYTNFALSIIETTPNDLMTQKRVVETKKYINMTHYEDFVDDSNMFEEDFVDDCNLFGEEDFVDDCNLFEEDFVDDSNLFEEEDFVDDCNLFEEDFVDDCNMFEEERTYECYNGSYAQDVEGWSDQDIDDVFDGDPDAYWNID